VDIRGSDIISPLLFFSEIYSSNEDNGNEYFRFFLRETQQPHFDGHAVCQHGHCWGERTERSVLNAMDLKLTEIKHEERDQETNDKLT